MKKYVILGSNSFSGAHCIAGLLKRGDCQVVGISRSREVPSVFLPYDPAAFANYQFCRLDLNKELQEVIALIHRLQPEYIINFVAQGMVGESWQAPEQWLATNLVSPVCMHQALRDCSFLEKFVQISTPEVYGNRNTTQKESDFYTPSTPYAVSKAAVDMSLMTFVHQYSFPAVFTRSANIYGPGQQLYRIIPKAILCFLTGSTLELHGGGHSVRSFIHIKDVIDGTLTVAHRAKPGEMFHFATTSYVSIRELVGMIAAQLGVVMDDLVKVVEDRPGKDQAYYLDSGKAREVLGWRDRIGLEQGIEQTISWVRDNFEILRKMDAHYIHKP